MPTYSQNTFEQTLRVDRLPSALSFAATITLPAIQGQRWTHQPAEEYVTHSL
jgi:hypothetical protein